MAVYGLCNIEAGETIYNFLKDKFMKMKSLILTLSLVFTASMAHAAEAETKKTNENGVAFMDYKCVLAESAKRLVFAESDVDIMAMGVMLSTKEKVLSVKLTAKTGTKQSSDLLLFLKRISKVENKSTYSFDTKLGAVLSVEEVSSEDGRTQLMKIQMTEESGTTETMVSCTAALIGN